MKTALFSWIYPILAALIFLVAAHHKSFAGDHPNSLRNCQRVVTLSPALGRVAFDILGPREFQERVVGVSSHTQLPSSQLIPQVASVVSLNIERILSLRPDCIFEAPGVLRRDRVEVLRSMTKRAKFDVDMLSLSMDRLRDIPQTYREMSKRFGKVEKAEELIRVFEARLRGLAGKLKGSRLLVQVDDEPLIVLGGAASFLSDSLEYLGAENVFSQMKEPYPRVSLEAARASQATELWILGEPDHQERYHRMAEAWRRRFPSWDLVKKNRIRVILSSEITQPVLDFAKSLDQVVMHESP